MSELASYALERLFEDGEFVLSRGVRQGNSTAVLVLSPALEQPVPETFRRLRNRAATANSTHRGV